MKPLKIIIVDDNDVFRTALKRILINEFNAEIIGEAANANEFMLISNIWAADIVFMDVMMPGTDGINLAKQSLWEYPELKIVAVTMHVDKVYLLSLVSAGFVGCIFKNKLFDQLTDAIKAIKLGKLFFPQGILLDQKKG